MPMHPGLQGNTEPSSVLLAMGLARERALGALRLTFGRWSMEGDVERAANALAGTVKRLKGYKFLGTSGKIGLESIGE